jgi:hypothetical protein
MDYINLKWPDLSIDREEVLFGAATHDIGKVVYRNELIEPGSRHESEGWKLLKRRNISSKLARFTQTHAKWKNDQSITLEDLVVALADKCWKGKRDDELELLLSKRIARETDQEERSVYISLDDIIQVIAINADERLAWQEKFSS